MKKGLVMAGKYTPLENYLLTIPEHKKEVRLSFEQIEGILKFRLPASAYEDERWWLHEKEGNHINLRAWTNAGWKIKSVNVNKKLARLVRS